LLYLNDFPYTLILDNTIQNLIGIGLNTLILWICVDFCGIEAMIAKILASGIVAFYGFFARKVLIYKQGYKEC